MKMKKYISHEIYILQKHLTELGKNNNPQGIINRVPFQGHIEVPTLLLLRQTLRRFR